MKNKLLFGLILGSLAGILAGTAVGGYYGFRHGMEFILNECLYGDARDIQSRVGALKHLRSGDRKQGIELLEARLDDALIMFDPNEPYPGLTQRTMAEMNKAIRESKEYRQAHPRQSNRPGIDEMVKNLFARQP
ncbi:MAG: hypothetical protein HYT79_07320 [Elusimicrobia bacterium]|nr:hypothetical protein [Elusimicrobiota bacterium]